MCVQLTVKKVKSSDDYKNKLSCGRDSYLKHLLFSFQPTMIRCWANNRDQGQSTWGNNHSFHIIDDLNIIIN